MQCILKNASLFHGDKDVMLMLPELISRRMPVTFFVWGEGNGVVKYDTAFLRMRKEDLVYKGA